MDILEKEVEVAPASLLEADVIGARGESYDKGKPRFTVVAAEGASPSAGEFRDFVNDAGGSYQAELTVLGHIQSGGNPTSFDRVLASRLGAAAVDALADDDSGKMVGLCGDEICRAPLDEVVGAQRPLDPELYKLAGVLSALDASAMPVRDAKRRGHGWLAWSPDSSTGSAGFRCENSSKKYSCGPRRFIRLSSRSASMCGTIKRNEANTTQGWQVT